MLSVASSLPAYLGGAAQSSVPRPLCHPTVPEARSHLNPAAQGFPERTRPTGFARMPATSGRVRPLLRELSLCLKGLSEPSISASSLRVSRRMGAALPDGTRSTSSHRFGAEAVLVTTDFGLEVRLIAFPVNGAAGLPGESVERPPRRTQPQKAACGDWKAQTVHKTRVDVSKQPRLTRRASGVHILCGYSASS